MARFFYFAGYQPIVSKQIKNDKKYLILVAFCKEIFVFLLPEKINKVKYYERKRQQCKFFQI